MMAATKVSVYSQPDLKNTTDDALPNYLTSLKFRHSHFLGDVRLALGYAAVIIAGALFVYDHRYGWEKSKSWTIGAVIAYFILNTALSLWVWQVEQGIVFHGTSDGIEITLSSTSPKYSPIYRLTVRTRPTGAASTNATWESRDIETPFTKWFTKDGFFVAQPFQAWLAAEVPSIGKAAKALKKSQ